MGKFVLCFHGGSQNHGSEAIIRGTAKILKKHTLDLFGFCIEQDKTFGLDKLANLHQVGIPWTHAKTKKHFLKQFIPSFILDLHRKIKVNKSDAVFHLYKKMFEMSPDLFIAVGGDNYCYSDYSAMAFVNKTLNDNNKKTVLWGCSIEPKDIKNDSILREDLKKYSLITARESLTYSSLIENGINKNVHLLPDPAFLLDTIIPQNLPKEFLPNDTIGINISPMVQRLEKEKDITYKNILNLINFIFEETQMNIALIPHVTWEDNNDLEPLKKLYNQFKYTRRICLIDKQYNCSELKGVISKCRFMIAARTHASIAAYSSQVPTLVVGYSVKACGIAKDIFGTYENYVLPVQNLKKENEIVNSFKNLMIKENKIKEHYKNFMPVYIEQVWQAAKEVEKLIK